MTRTQPPSRVAPTLTRRSLLGTAGLALAAAYSAANVPACAPAIRTAAPPGLEPLEPTNRAPSASTAPYPETLALVSGDGDGYAWVHGRGYIRAPLRDVWPGIHNADACSNRRAVSEYMVTPNTQPAYAHSFRIHNIVRDVILVEFDVDWRLDVTYGALDAPTSVAGRFEKISGSDVISLMRGSVIARQIDENTTEVELIEHLDSLINRDSIARAYLTDYFGSILALAHDRPLPTYR